MANPFILIIGISIFNLFNIKQFHNEIINKISSLSLLYYVIHENILFRKYIRPHIYIHILNKVNNHFLTTTILVILMFAVGMLLSFIYKNTLQKIVHKCSSILFNYLKKKYLIIEKKFSNVS